MDEARSQSALLHCQFLNLKADRLLKTYHKTQTHPETPLSYYQRLTKVTQEITSRCQQWMEEGLDKDQSVQIDFLLMCGQRLSKSVSLYVKAAEESCQNSLDLLLQETKKNLGRDIFRCATCIKLVIEMIVNMIEKKNGFNDTGPMSPSKRANFKKPYADPLGLKSLLIQVHEIATVVTQLLETAIASDSDKVHTLLPKVKAVFRGFQCQLSLSRDATELQERLTKILALVKIQTEDLLKQTKRISVNYNDFKSPLGSATYQALQKQVLRTQHVLADELLEIIFTIQNIQPDMILRSSVSKRKSSSAALRSSQQTMKITSKSENYSPRPLSADDTTVDFIKNSEHRRNMRRASESKESSEKLPVKSKSKSPHFPRTRVSSDTPTVPILKEVRNSSSRDGRASEVEHIEAELLAMLPTIYDEFKSQFPWFAKYWAKETVQNKSQISNTLTKHFLKLTQPDLDLPEEDQEYPAPQIPQSPRQNMNINLKPIRKTLTKFSLSKLNNSAEHPSVWQKLSARATDRTILGKNSVEILQKSYSITHSAKESLQNATLTLLQDSSSLDTKLELYQTTETVIKALEQILGVSNQETKQTPTIIAIQSIKQSIISKFQNFSAMDFLSETPVEVVSSCLSKSEARTQAKNLARYVRHYLLPSVDSLVMQLVDTIQTIPLETTEIAEDGTLLLVMISRSLLECLSGLFQTLGAYSTVSSVLSSDLSLEREMVQPDPNLFGRTSIWSTSVTEFQPFDVTKTDLNEIIRYLTTSDSPVEYASQLERNLFLTYRGWTSAAIIVRTLEDRFRIPSFVIVSSKVALQIKSSVCALLCRFVENSGSFLDFTVSRMIGVFCAEISKEGFEEEAKQIRMALLSKDNNSSESLIPLSFTAPPGIKFNYETLLAQSAKDVAEQLTLIDSVMFYSIQKHELIGQAWNKDNLKHTAPNVINILNRLNKLSYWIPSFILMHQKVQQRAKIVTWFIDIATNLHEMGNFSSLMGIVAGLTLSVVDRLQFTWSCVNQSKTTIFKQFQTLMNPSNSYTKYRRALAASPVPAVPYLGVSLIDLTFIDEGNPDYIEGKLNFAKQELIAKILHAIEKFQQIKYRIDPVQPLYAYLNDLPLLGADDLHTLSMLREPRGAEISAIL